MIDSITLRVPVKDGNEWYKKVGNSKWSDENTVAGSIGNMRIYQRPGLITISGSLGKYLNGNNMDSFNKDQVRLSIEKLERETGINLREATVSELEFGVCVWLDRPVSVYLQLMQVPPRYELHSWVKSSGDMHVGYSEIETVHIKTKTSKIELIMYNKLAEIKKKNRPIPEKYAEQNVLRIEYRIKHKEMFVRTFNRILKAYDLFDPLVHEKLKERLLVFYDKVPKDGGHMEIVSLNNYAIKNRITGKGGLIKPATVVKLWAIYMWQKNIALFFNFLRDLQANGSIDKATYKAARAQMLKSVLAIKSTEQDSLAIELREKLERALYQ